jgi:acyl-CoA thioester hydrolase
MAEEIFLMTQLVARIRVRFDETDQQRVVHHGNYFNYFEVARVEFFRSVGFDYRTVEETGLRLVVVEATAKYARPAFFDDELDLFLSVAKVGLASVVFDYEIQRGSVRLATGQTKLACLGSNNKPRRFPGPFREALATAVRPTVAQEGEG